MTDPKRLYRSRSDRTIAGVCGGLAAYFGMDATIVRVVWALVTIFSAFVPGVIAYVVLALIMPEEPYGQAPTETVTPPQV